MKKLLYVLIGLAAIVLGWYLLSDQQVEEFLPEEQPADTTQSPTPSDEGTTGGESAPETITATGEAVISGSATVSGEGEFDPEQFQDEEIEELLQLMEDMLRNN